MVGRRVGVVVVVVMCGLLLLWLQLRLWAGRRQVEGWGRGGRLVPGA